MNALKLWALGALKAIAGAVVPVLVMAVCEAILQLPTALGVTASAAATGATVYAVRNRTR